MSVAKATGILRPQLYARPQTWIFRFNLQLSISDRPPRPAKHRVTPWWKVIPRGLCSVVCVRRPLRASPTSSTLRMLGMHANIGAGQFVHGPAVRPKVILGCAWHFILSGLQDEGVG